MSNKIVPTIYRAVIDDVINAVREDFEKFDVSEDILAELQRKWENKVIQSRVADFEVAPPPTAATIQHQPYPSHPHAIYAPPGAHSYAPTPTLSHYAPHPHASGVKTEPLDPRYVLNPTHHQMVYAVPPLAGPQLNSISRPPAPGGQTSILSFPPGPPQTTATTAQNGANGATATAARPYSTIPTAASTSSTSVPQPRPPTTTPVTANSNSGGGGSGGRIPQLDGPSEDDEDSDEDSHTPPPLPRSNHPSLPQVSQSGASMSNVDAEAINSDLDDSDIDDEDENQEEGTGVDTDILFCMFSSLFVMQLVYLFLRRYL